MANETKITEIVDPAAIKQVETLNSRLAEVRKSYMETIRSIGEGLKLNPTNLSELNAMTTAYNQNVKNLQSTVIEHNKVVTEQCELLKKLSQAQKEYNFSVGNAAKQTQTNVDQSTSSITKESNAILDNAKAKQQEVVISKELKSLIDLTLGTREENIRRVAQEKTALAQLSKEKASLNKLERSGAISVQDAVKKRQELINSEMTHRESLRGLLNILTNETKIITSSSDSYQEQALQLERLRMAYRLLSADVANSKLGIELQKNISTLDAQVKNTDKTLGQFHRNVGNYTSAWNGLGNAINQLTREAPAFAVSLQTGFLAISNNIPILIDEIARIRNENAALRNEGVKGVPVWKQLAKSVLSWNTLLSVGITLLTVYGKDIFEWGKNLLSYASSSKAASDAQKDLNSSTGEYSKALKNSLSSYGQNLVSLKKLQEEWKSLGGNIEKQKQFIIDNASEFKKLDVSITNVTDAENVLVTNTDAFIKAMELRARAAAAQKLAQEKYAEALEKRIEAENRQKEADDARKNGKYAVTAVMQDTRYGSVKSAKELAEENAAAIEVDVQALKNQADALEAAGKAYIDYNEQQTEAARKELESANIKEATNEEKLKRQKEKLEREAKQKEKLEMEAERNIQESRLRVLDEGYKKDRFLIEQSFQKRIDDVKTKGVRVNEQIKALEAERSKALLEFDRKTSEQRMTEETNNRIAIAEKGSAEELDARIDLLELQRQKELREAEKTGQDRLLIEAKYNKLIGEAYNNYVKDQLKKEQAENEIRLNERQEQINKELAQLKVQQSKGLMSKKVYEQKKADLEFEFATQSIQNEIDLLEANLDLFEGDERLSMEKKISDLRLALSKKTTDKIIDDAEKEKKKREEIEKAKIALVREAASAIESIGNSMFERQINNIDAEIEANQTEYDEKVSIIESLAEKDIISSEEAEARKRAAEEETAAKNKELEKKKAELQARQAKFQKAIDVGQTIANTAAAIMAQLKATPLPFGAPLVALIAATGAIQLATILAQPIPKYAKGTDNHPGGPAIVGDGGKNEAILIGGKMYVTPSVPTLMSIPQGAEIIPEVTDPEFLRRIMDNTYWLTHNKKGEPVQIVNNFDAEGIIRANNDVKNEIRKLAGVVSKNARAASFEDYKRRRMS